MQLEHQMLEINFLNEAQSHQEKRVTCKPSASQTSTLETLLQRICEGLGRKGEATGFQGYKGPIGKEEKLWKLAQWIKMKKNEVVAVVEKRLIFAQRQ